MTPAARVQAAVEALDRIAVGAPAEKVLTGWARAARYAGSKDRAAVRDHVFDALRRWWSAAALGGAESGRGRMIGMLRARGEDPATLFTGAGFGPAPLTAAEATLPPPPGRLVALDCPPWLAPALEASLGADFAPVMGALQLRAPAHLRVALSRLSRDAAMAGLADEGIEARPHPLSPSALEMAAPSRRVATSAAYRNGLVELQDAASQAVADMIPLRGSARVLDYCAGGGGKTLAMADRHPAAAYHAHDIRRERMADLPARAARAGVAVAIRDPQALAGEPPYDLVLVDAPCSGSGAWRRAPEGKIRLTPARLDELGDLQARIIDAALGHLRPGGVLVYATCSLLRAENEEQTAKAMARHPLALVAARRLTPLDGGDGFYCATLRFNP